LTALGWLKGSSGNFPKLNNEIYGTLFSRLKPVSLSLGNYYSIALRVYGHTWTDVYIQVRRVTGCNLQSTDYSGTVKGENMQPVMVAMVFVSVSPCIRVYHKTFERIFPF
jgi:hypothetical protein